MSDTTKPLSEWRGRRVGAPADPTPEVSFSSVSDPLDWDYEPCLPSGPPADEPADTPAVVPSKEPS